MGAPFVELCASLKEQQRHIDDELARKDVIDRDIANGSIVSSAVSDAGSLLKIDSSIYQLDIERVRFLISAYSRTRLRKV